MPVTGEIVKMKKPFMIAAAMLLFCAASAAGQTAAPAPITVGSVVDPWLQYILAAFVAVVTALVPVLVAIVNKKFNIENDANIAAIEKQASDTLQSALTNGAGRVAVILGDKLDQIPLTPDHPAVAAAIKTVSTGARDAIDKFGLSPQQLGDMIINKVGVLTAASPVAPATTEAALPPKA